MFAAKTCLVFMGVFALQAYGHRYIRSPDKMEIGVPHPERGSGEYQEDMNKEGEYWSGQGDKYGDKGNEGHGQMDENREKNEETYNHEMEHHNENQQTYHNDMNQTYQQDRDRVESHHEDNLDHQESHTSDYEYTTPNLPDMTETGDRYEEKGDEYREEGENAMGKYGDNPPSITYTKN